MQPVITLQEHSLKELLKSNMSCHLNKPLSPELMDELVTQIIDSIDYFINKKEETL
jgi:hypothetical protein